MEQHEHTAQLQAMYNLPAQGATESDCDFRHRIAGSLRDMGNLIEAHEAQQNARYDDDENGKDVITGVMGAMAQALQGVDYRVHGQQQIGCDMAAGAIVRHKKEEMSPQLAMLLLGLR